MSKDDITNLEHDEWEFYIDGLHVSKYEHRLIEIDLASLRNNGYNIIFYGDEKCD